MRRTELILEAQGYEVTENIMVRDNQSSVKLETNGKASSGNRPSHFKNQEFPYHRSDRQERCDSTILNDSGLHDQTVGRQTVY